MQFFRIISFTLVLVAILHAQKAEAVRKITQTSSACTSSEKWDFGNDISKAWRQEFLNFMLSKTSTVRGFSEGLALRKTSTSLEAKYFAEYWVSRSLLNAKLYHIAYAGFGSVLAKPTNEGTIGIQLAALDCIILLKRKYPALEFSEPVVGKISELLKDKTVTKNSPSYERIVFGAGSSLFIELLSKQASKQKIEVLLGHLKGGGHHEYLASGLWHAFLKKHDLAILNSLSFLNKKGMPIVLKRYSDQMRLVLARSYYRTGNFSKASKTLQLVQKNSNELTRSLSEISWAFLRSNMKKEAIGAALALDAGNLRQTFAPEAPMVMAMAFNEICQYPESLRSIGVFRGNYGDSYQWLHSWYKKKTQDLYPLAINYLKGSNDVPQRVASEWVRSPLFLSRQDELNLLIQGKRSTGKLAQKGSKEQRSTARDLLKFSKKVRASYRLAKIKLKPGEKLPNYVQKDLDRLSNEVTHYQRLNQAGPIWNAILINYKMTSQKTENNLLKEINRDLASLSVRMLKQIEEVADNNELIEVEIYNGASRDIVWKNAHPDYEKKALKIQNGDRKKESASVWSWGSLSLGPSEAAEIWDDEVGSFKADIYDNCSSKDRYLVLKRDEVLAGLQRVQ